MIYSLKIQMLFSILMAIGCVVSPLFAALVVSGAGACALGVVGVYAVYGSHEHPITRTVRMIGKGYRLLADK